MKDYLQFLLTPLLSIPEALEITVGQSVITIKIAQADMGRVIGKQGNNISALRTLVRTYCSLHQIDPVSLTLEEAQTDHPELSTPK